MKSCRSDGDEVKGKREEARAFVELGLADELGKNFSKRKMA
jgi:hypothetical protein